ncbi:hypothetical protein R6Q59_028112 [Mikania micrantha]
MAAAVVARSVLRSVSTSVRASASRLSGAAKPNFIRSPFFIRPQKPLSHRIFRSPVEISCVAVESLFLFHTANASALQTSMLPTVLYSFGWPIDDS